MNLPALPHDSLHLTSGVRGANGTAAINGDGTFAFTPAPTFRGVATFQYAIADAAALTDAATAVVTVPPPPPVTREPAAASGSAGPSVNTHVAVTRDGGFMRFSVKSVQAGQVAQAGM